MNNSTSISKFSLWATICLLFLSVSSRAQLSGSYSVCSGTGCNYSSIGAAVSDLVSKGISGAVTFNVGAGTYIEYITIPAITGSSSKNTITFKGAGRTKTFLKGTSGSNVLSINNAIYVTFDGFTIQNTSSSGVTVSQSGTSNCSIINSNILTVNGGGSNYNVQAQNTNYLNISNCYLYGGYFGFAFTGSSGTSSSPIGNLTFNNNRVIKFTQYGIYVTNSGYVCENNTYSNNVFDSSNASSAYSIYSISEDGAAYKGNASYAATAYPAILENCNTYVSSKQYLVANNFLTNFSGYGIYLYVPSSSSNVLVAHNTIYTDSTMKCSAAMNVSYSGSAKGLSLESNILEVLATNASNFVCLSLAGNSSSYNIIDGNDIICPGLTTAYVFGNTYTDFASYQKAMEKSGWEANASSLKPVYVKAPTNLHLNQSKAAPIGVYCGVDVDIDGDSRCKLFPTAGADESTYGKAPATVKFFLPSITYPSSPTIIYSTAKAGDPKIYYWYLNGKLVSDSLVLLTSGFTVGVNTLKLVIVSCSGKDSFQKNDTVKAPSSAPVVDFISNINKITTGGVVAFQDISSNGPTSWSWTISPQYSYPNGVQTANYSYVYGSSSSFAPQVQFNVAGNYKVCLTTTNSVGSATAVCKTNYVAVISSINLGNNIVARDVSGFLYDDGGPNAPYISGGGTVSTLIDPCADTVYLTFSKFDVYCGNGFVKLYEGRDNTGKLLGSCAGGFTGGTTFTCSGSCMPNTSKPDTFKAKNTMFVQMSDGANSGASGFTAYWWSTPKTSKKPTASFTTSNAGDSVCANHSLIFSNTTSIDPNDPASFLWDLDGDMTTFECIGACKTAIEPYYVLGTTKVTLVATNCGGSDTTTRKITVFNPKSPISGFTVDNLTPTTADIAFFSPSTSTCVDDYSWTITKSSGTGTATYVNGTSSISANPQVMFSDTGYYDVVLYVDNAAGKNTATKTKYIHVRQPYCIPAVASQLSDIGITKVVFNTLSNTTKPAAADYTSFVNTPSLATTVEKGVTYQLTVKRDTPSYNAIIRSVYIDWDGDGIFSAAERVAVDSNSTSIAWNKKILVPKTAKTGATVMRIAVNGGSYTNYPCGANQLGEYQDYRIYVVPYRTLPVITLKGKSGLLDTNFVELGYQYTEPGYSASSIIDGDITPFVTVSVTSLKSVPYPGAVLYTYNVTDAEGLSALTVYRIVKYTKDKTPPILVVTGPDTTTIEVFHSYVLPTIFEVFDIVTKNLSPTVDSSKVNPLKIGMYPIIYSVTDSAGNVTTVFRYLHIIDTIAPVLKLNGNPIDTIGINISYKDPGVTATDNYFGTSTLDSLVIVNSDLDTSFYGIYTITYSLTDPAGNVAKTVTRTVVVKDMIPPLVKLKGSAIDSIPVFTSYIDPGYSALDNFDNLSQMKITRTGTFYANFPTGYGNVTGNFYTITYTAQDRAGNKGSATRIVKVQDLSAPVISLNGNPVASVCRWFKYIDAGYTVSDNYDSVKYIHIDTLGSFVSSGRTSRDGFYSIQYMATDRAGNSTKSDSRAIQVLPASDPSCTSGIETGLGLDNYIQLYPNPNNGQFMVNIGLPTAQRVKMVVYNVLGSQVMTVYEGECAQNKLNVDMSNQASGIYFLNIVAGNQNITKRIEISR